jgi:hypothetical protein
MKILAIILLVALLVIVMPIAIIWSLNTLFPVLAIPVTIDTWMASIILSGAVGGSAFSFGSRK